MEKKILIFLLKFLKAFLIMILILVGLVYFLFFHGSYRDLDEDKLALILGLSKATLLSSDYSREYFTVHDYYAIEVHQLSRETINDFVAHSSFELYPEMCGCRKENWQQSPIDTVKWGNVMEMAFVFWDSHPKRNEWISEMQSLITSSSGYYAFCIFEYSIILYVLDVESGKLYIMYTNNFF